MARRPRRILPNEFYFLTIRTHQELFLLNAFGPIVGNRSQRRKAAAMARICQKKADDITRILQNAEDDARPSITLQQYKESVNSIIGAWLAKAVAFYKAEFYGCICMSDHIHLLVRVPSGKLSDFAGYFNGNVAKALNRKFGRTHQFWARRYSLEPVLDDDALLERLIYMMANPSKANLVSTIQHWPGFNTACMLLEAKQLSFTFFNRTKWWRAKRPENISPFLEVVTLKQHVLPCFKDQQHQSSTLVQRLEQKEQQLSIDRKHDKKTVLGVEGLEQVSHLDRAKNPKHTSQPLCHASTKQRRKEFLDLWRVFLEERKIASEKYRDGDVDVVFPWGAFAPSKYPVALYQGQKRVKKKAA